MFSIDLCVISAEVSGIMEEMAFNGNLKMVSTLLYGLLSPRGWKENHSKNCLGLEADVEADARTSHFLANECDFEICSAISKKFQKLQKIIKTPRLRHNAYCH